VTPTTETNFDCIFIVFSCDVITDNCLGFHYWISVAESA